MRTEKNESKNPTKTHPYFYFIYLFEMLDSNSDIHSMSNEDMHNIHHISNMLKQPQDIVESCTWPIMEIREYQNELVNFQIFGSRSYFQCNVKFSEF